MARRQWEGWGLLGFESAAAEPILHILLILGGWAIAKSFGLPGDWGSVPRLAPETLNQGMIFMAGYLFIFRGGTEIVRDFLDRLASLRQLPDQTPQVGRIIGNLERFLIVTIAFVLTAKSVARFRQIEEEKGFAEYCLDGTLTSSAIGVVVGVLLKILPLNGVEIPLLQE